MKQSFLLIFFLMSLSLNHAIYSKFLTYGKWPDETVRLKLMSVQNDTEKMEFQIFYHYDSPSGFVAPKSIFLFPADKEIAITPGNLLMIKCVKGPFKSVFIQDSLFPASQSIDETKVGYSGPYFISMWLGEPQVSEEKKIKVRYWLKTGTVGVFGVTIGKKGDYRLVAHENILFIE